MLLRSDFLDEQFRKVIPGTEKIIDTASTKINPGEKLAYLYNIVKTRFPAKAVNSYAPDHIEDAWKSRTASSAEMNMILMNLLKRSGITCHPVLVSTRDNGKIKISFPSFGQFNGMDVLVTDNNSTYIIDASSQHQSYDIPPFNILNREVFILDPDNIRWAMVTDDRFLLKQTTNIFSTLTAEGKMEAGATITYYDYAKSLALDSSKTKFDNNDVDFADAQIPGFKLLSDKKEYTTDGPLVQTIEFDYETEQSGDFYFIKPQLLAVKKKNPFTADKRNTDIDFGCNQQTELNMTLSMPAAFEVEHLPQNIFVRSPDSSFSFKRTVHAGPSNIVFSEMFEIRKPIFDKNEYAGLYEFFNYIQSLMNEEIILKKKK